MHFWRLSCQVERALCPAALIRENIHPETEEEKDESRQSEFIKQKQKKITSGFSEFELEFREDRQIYVKISVCHLILCRWKFFFSI